jgi:hypothetical protein
VTRRSSGLEENPREQADWTVYTTVCTRIMPSAKMNVSIPSSTFRSLLVAFHSR